MHYGPGVFGHKSHKNVLNRLALASLLLSFCGAASAETIVKGAQPTEQPDYSATRLNLTRLAGSGLERHRLTDGRSLIGWKLSNTLYFGRAKKEGGTVAVVWEQSSNQRISLSTDGLKLTRRFR